MVSVWAKSRQVAVALVPVRRRGRLVELAAQAAAAHASLFNIRGNQTGLLVALKSLMPMRQFIESVPEPFSIFADQLHFDANGSIYRFRISSGDIDFLAGQVTLKMKGEPE